MKVAVNSNIVTRIGDQLSRFRKTLHRMPGDVPCRDDSVSLEQVHKARHASFCPEYTARDIARRILASKRSNPQRHCVKVGIDAHLNIFDRHDVSSVSSRTADLFVNARSGGSRSLA